MLNVGTGNVYASGSMPVYSSKPNTLADSPVYFSYTTGQLNIKRAYGSNTDNIDYFYFINTNNNNYVLTFVSGTSGTILYKQYNSESVGSSNLSTSYSGKYYTTVSTSADTFDTTFPYLGQFSDNNSAIYYYIQNGVTYPVDNTVKYPFTLQNGYLFVYDLGSNSDMYSLDLTSKSEEYSNIGSEPFPDTNQSYWFTNTLPEIDETTIPASGAFTIEWSKGSKTNIFGQTQDMVSSISGTSTGRYLCIYNPPVHYKWSGSSNPTASEVINYPVTIDGISDNDTWYIYDSVARLSDFNQGGSVSGTVTGEQITGTVSSDGAISLNTSSGAVYTQNSGGSTDISGANGGSIAENINGLKQTLDNFVNQFIQLLSAPISHIQQLIQSGNSFFDVFGQLFEWLPSSVSSVLISGLIIMVVIGVLKMLL